MIVAQDPVNVDVQDDLGRTALHLAAEECQVATYLVLRAFDARDDIEDTFGSTAKSIAMNNQDLKALYNANP